jgi:hypothetical protein
MGLVKARVTHFILDDVVNSFRSVVRGLAITSKQSVYEVTLDLPGKPDCTAKLELVPMDLKTLGVIEASFVPVDGHEPWNYRWGGEYGNKLTEV